MKKGLVLIVMLFCIFVLVVQLFIEGIWNIGKENIKIEIVVVNGIYVGKIVFFDNVKVKIGV